ncbi:hypothetical protein GQ42DRAFT_163085 [Ramicandelaber brevisporus]|nr:hypothetical protein GQ42DRAFT_163085 [Ramicandelaber brevisporus]
MRLTGEEQVHFAILLAKAPADDIISALDHLDAAKRDRIHEHFQNMGKPATLSIVDELALLSVLKRPSPIFTRKIDIFDYITNTADEREHFSGEDDEVFGFFLKRFLKFFESTTLGDADFYQVLKPHLKGKALAVVENLPSQTAEDVIAALRRFCPDAIQLRKYRANVISGERYKHLSIHSMLGHIEHDIELFGGVDMPEVIAVIDQRFASRPDLHNALQVRDDIYSGIEYIKLVKSAIKDKLPFVDGLRHFVMSVPKSKHFA